jgi:hypothetical protein
MSSVLVAGNAKTGASAAHTRSLIHWSALLGRQRNRTEKQKGTWVTIMSDTHSSERDKAFE